MIYDFVNYKKLQLAVQVFPIYLVILVILEMVTEGLIKVTYKVVLKQ
jgi:hypothetical protein